MPHSESTIWIHAICITKDRAPLVNDQLERLLLNFMADQLRNAGCYVKAINGMPDHVHCLFSLNRNKCIADIMQLVKGASSHYVNQNGLLFTKFKWQPGYATYSVSRWDLEKITTYIEKQKDHHRNRTIRHELEDE